MSNTSTQGREPLRGLAFFLGGVSALWVIATLCCAWWEAGRLSTGSLTVLVGWSICMIQIRAVVRASDAGIRQDGALDTARSIGVVQAASGAAGRALAQLRGVYQTPSESPAASAAPSARA